MAETAFTTNAFAASGAPTARTMPVRLSDVTNVKDWGAVGNGVTNDTTAIQDAIDHIYEDLGGGILFFPAGTYIVGSPGLELSRGVGGSGTMSLLGAGRDVSIIKGNYGGPLLHQQPYTGNFDSLNDIKYLTLWNQSVAAGSLALFLQYKERNPAIVGCKFIGVWALGSDNGSGGTHFGQSIRDCIFECSSPIGAANSATPGPLAGSVGCFCSQGLVVNCIATGFDVGFGTSLLNNIIGCRASRCNTGIKLGWARDNPNMSNVQASSIISNRTDRCRIGIYWNSTQGTTGFANVMTGTEGPATAAAISNITWNGTTTATVTTTLNHNISGAQRIAIVTNPVAWTPDSSGTEVVTATPTGANTFTYPLTHSAGAFSSGTWNYPVISNIQVHGAKVVTLASNVLSAVGENSFVADSGRYFQYNATCISMRGPHGWWMPSDFNSVYWSVINCGVAGAAPPTSWKRIADFQVAWDGLEENVTDAQVQAAFDGAVSAGGANHYKVRYNGSSWRRVG